MSAVRWWAAGVSGVLLVLLGLLAIATFAPSPVVVPTVGIAAPPDDATGRLRATTALADRSRLLGDREQPASIGDVAVAPDRVPSTRLASSPGVTAPAGAVRQWQEAARSSEAIARGAQYVRGETSLPYENMGMLEQPEGRDWRRSHNGPLTYGGAWIIFGVSLVLSLLLLFRGRIRIKEGRAGSELERFSEFERTNHWMTAGAFVVLALTGLVILYGKTLLLPLLGPALFGDVALVGARLHMAAAAPLTLGVLAMVVLWLRQNLPTRLDWEWLKQGGGFLETEGENPPARKFNAGQKIVFWGVTLGSLAALASGVTLMLPFFWFGFDGMQWAQLVHGAVGLLMIGLIIGHIYIGTVGMEGAIDAMWSGKVDENWAKEHHSIWYRERRGGEERRPTAPPAE